MRYSMDLTTELGQIIIYVLSLDMTIPNSPGVCLQIYCSLAYCWVRKEDALQRLGAVSHQSPPVGSLSSKFRT